mgnify:FL=1
MDKLANLLERCVGEAIQGQDKGMARVQAALDTFGGYRRPASDLSLAAFLRQARGQQRFY